MESIEDVEYKGYVIKLYPDEDSESPRQWDNLGHMACFHRHYALGDNYQDRPDHCNDPDNFQEWVKEQGDEIAIILPLYLYDHSGITMWTQDGIRRYHQHYAWDGGQVGWIYVLKSDIRAAFNVKRISKKNLEHARQLLISEVQTYDKFLIGDVYGYKVFQEDEETDLSCWGFFGESDAIQYAKEDIDAHLEYTHQQELHLIESGVYEI